MTKKSILFVCPYPFDKAPSQRLKFEQYYDYFKENDYEITHDSFQSIAMWNVVYKSGHIFLKFIHTVLGYLSRIWLLFRLPFYDVVYIHLWVTPFGPPFFERLYRLFSRKIIYDIDDLVFMENSSEANAWIAKLKGKNKPIFLMKNADAIITTTPYLVHFCQQFNQHVHAIPPSLDESIFFPFLNNEKVKLTIGWLGSHTTEAYLEIVRPALESLAKELDYRMITMGAKNFRLKGVELINKEWSASQENEILNEIDIAIYPLPEAIWSQGKFGGKLIQYFAAGLPCIASDVNESNRIVIKNSVNGILVKNSDDEWLLALRLLAANESLRRKIGEQARLDFMNKYSHKANENKYLNILNAVTKN